ncbi:hypothetical protein Cgig2_002001 [Carnegiea gigantea]|uniref:FAD-binding domain-containing protein n=1 Tax=Carnegiea gigantea TaxID=171969 RepID=A0A9Q1JQV4_9CARY|nr:hypothetical protein Cgig2_002001 [Carnegiea gigantea]
MGKKAVVVGGSIAGVSCAHALSAAGWEVVVLEKSSSGPTGSPTGAGLGLDPLSCKIIHSWLGVGDGDGDSDPLFRATMPLSIEQNQATDVEKKMSWTLTRDEEFNFRAAHWVDLHALLLGSLPPQVTFLWGHYFTSFHLADDQGSVTLDAKVLQTGEIVQIVGDLLVAADGCLSSIRQTFLPLHKLRFGQVRIGLPYLRYAAYCAWRGVLNFTEIEDSETIQVKKMKEDAESIWLPELAHLMKSTPEPFVNVIYDSDPLDRLFWDNVVLVGDAAHPTTPHCVRSTNMSILDAAVLGKCLEKWGSEDLKSALNEYQSLRLPVVAKQVLHARRVGRIKQGLSLPDCKPFDAKKASVEDCFELQQKNVPFFSHIPDALLN